MTLTRFTPFADENATEHDRYDALASYTACKILGWIEADNWAGADGAVRLGLRNGLDYSLAAITNMALGS